MSSPDLIVCFGVSLFVVSGMVAFGPKALYEPNRTGRFSTVLISHCQFQFPNAGVKRTLFMIGLVVQVIIR